MSDTVYLRLTHENNKYVRDDGSESHMRVSYNERLEVMRGDEVVADISHMLTEAITIAKIGATFQVKVTFIGVEMAAVDKPPKKPVALEDDGV